MSVDVRFGISNVPGAIARAARALADAGVNVEGIGCDIRPGETWGFVHFLVSDLEATRTALASVGVEILDVHDVELVDREDRPGSLAEICESYTARGENIEVLYLGSSNKLVVGTESMRKAWVGRTASTTSYSDPGHS